MSWVQAALRSESPDREMEEILKQLVAANIQAQARHEEAQTRLEQANLQTQQAIVQVAGLQQQTNQHLAAQVEAQQDQLAALVKRLPSAVAPGNQVARSPSHYLQKLNPHDDVEAFLTTFERVAEREAWPRDQWAAILAPFLTGEPQRAYCDLPAAEVQDYDKLKGEILTRLGVTTAVRAQRMHAWTFCVGQSPRSQMHDLLQLTTKWLQPETLTGPQIVERVALDRYLRALPDALRRWVSLGDPKTLSQLVEMIERYLVTEDLQEWSRSRGTAPPRRRQPTPRVGIPESQGVTTPVAQSSAPAPRSEGVLCWRCHTRGHVQAQCPQREEPMECGILQRTSYYAQVSCASYLDMTEGRFECDLWVNQHHARALLDSGSMVTLVHQGMVGAMEPTRKTLRVVCIHGDIREYPLVSVTITTACGTVTQEVGVVPTLIHDIIVGRDCPLFVGLWDYVSRDPSQPRDPCSLPAELDTSNQLTLDHNRDMCETVIPGEGIGDRNGSTESAEGGEHSPVRVLVGEEVEAIAPLHLMSEDEDEENTARLIHPDLNVSRGAFATAQLRDPTLKNAWEQVVVTNGVAQIPGAESRYPHFAATRDLVYRVTEIRGEVVDQLLVPQPYRRLVLELAHNDALGGHLGAEKTEARVTDRFYWPGITAEVKRYCASCPVCQLTAPVSHFRNPLVPLPIIEVPFERIAMDLVGPLVKSTRGHQYILVTLDYATRYPEAVPLRKTSSKAIARELFQMFSRTGFPKEILTDQGTPFMSKVMADLCRLFQIKQMRTSVYHPQTDGLVERFNKTLKSMLKRVVQQDGKDWDCLLPALMFAIREVPQASTGFSPFELVYGRRPRGLLDLVKETWESESSPHKTLVEHITQMRERIAKIMPLVREHLQSAQEAQRRVYNRTAKTRQFQVGDRVAVLIPTVESKFLAKWQGPFEVVEKVGEVTYRVHQPGKRKPYQIYHINLLKPWRDREQVVALAEVKPRTSVRGDQIPVSTSLSKPQLQEVREFLQRNRGVFTELPGRTTVVEHNIVTQPGIKVRVKPYRIPEAHRKAVSEEIRTMLKLGIIEESLSEWSSPIVLVPKPNGTLRFCNDFRKLNEVSQFDAYPMPRVDELIEKLGPARYITTLDLTKGYWQIPLTKEARAKTAFSTPEGHFQYKRMPFGLHSAPATFQRAMDTTLHRHQRYTAVYLDDIVIFSADWDSHLPRVQAVVNSLKAAGFTINPEKCAIGMEEARYLGYIVGRGLVKPQTSKVEAIQAWPRPVTKRQVRAFLGIVGYYRRFVPNFASIAGPLTDLTKGKKALMIQWNDRAERAFQELKAALCRDPVLISPDFSREFIVQTDASSEGLGAVLSQEVNGEEHPVVFLSRKLTPAERNYAVVEREGLAIKWALDSLRYFLLGRKFRLVSDHAPLTWMKQNKNTNARVTRWFLSLQEFKFSVEHRAGTKHQNADALSRVHCRVSHVASDTPASRQRGGICTGRRGCVLYGRYVSPLFRPYSGVEGVKTLAGLQGGGGKSRKD